MLFVSYEPRFLSIERFGPPTFSVSMEFLNDLFPTKSSPEFFELLVEPILNFVI